MLVNWNDPNHIYLSCRKTDIQKGNRDCRELWIRII